MPVPTPSSHVRTHWLGTALQAAGQALVAVVYAGGANLAFWLASLAFALLGAQLARRRSYQPAVGMSVAAFVAFYWTAHAVLPLGPAPWALFVSLALTTFSLERSLRRAAAVLAVAGGLPLTAVAYGFAGADASAALAIPSTLATLGVVSVITVREFGASWRRLARATSAVADLRAGMTAEHARLRERERLLSEAAAVNRVELDALTAQLVREADLMDDLRLRQADQRGVVEAIHHDLREPLRIIVSFTQLAKRRLERYPGSETLADYLSFAEDGGRRMAGMLEDLTAYANDAHEGEGDAEAAAAVPLGEVVAEVRLNVHDAVERRGATVTVGPLAAVVGRRTPLVQLFQNLVSNALKFSRPGVAPAVDIAAYERADGLVGVRVADNGIGIPANQIDKVFGLFNRAHAEGDYEGSGVGLALCRKIVIAHGGEISVASVAGEGTEFFIGLRAAPAPADARLAAPAAAHA